MRLLKYVLTFALEQLQDMTRFLWILLRIVYIWSPAPWLILFCVFTHVASIYANLLEQKKAF